MQKSKTSSVVGVIFLIASLLLWLSLLALPFISLSVKGKSLATALILIVAEIFFWLGAILVGKSAYTKYKRQLNPKNWLNKNKASNTK